MISFIREEKTQRYKLSIKPIMLKLYQAGWTAIDWEDRQKMALELCQFVVYGRNKL
jgi:hypothetical protein